MDYAAKLLLVAHGAAAIVLIGSATHNGILAFYHLLGRPTRKVLQRLYVRIVGWSYLATFTLGLLNYPAFRVQVRAAFLDQHVPLATGFFEIKEHWLGIGLIVLACYWPMSRTLDIRERTADAVLYHVLGLVLLAIVWLAMFTGLMLVAIRPVGG